MSANQPPNLQQQPFPNLQSQVVNSNGTLTTVWRTFFTQIWNRTGGATAALYAFLNGDADQVFNVAPATTSTEAIPLGQLATPPKIGNTTPNSGAFTDLSSSGTVSGMGFSTYLASPPPIGGTIPNEGAFTALSASGSVNGAGFTVLLSPYATIASVTAQLANYAPISSPTFIGTATFANLTVTGILSGAGFTNLFASPPPLGSSVAASGSFTTLSVTGLISPASTYGIKGTIAADSAQAGSIGEYLTSNAGPTPLTSGSSVNLISLSLTSGDWDVWGTAQINPAGTTVLDTWGGGISLTSATQPAYNSGSQFLMDLGTNGPTGAPQVNPTGTTRINVSSTTTVYLVGNASFSIGTAVGYGAIFARRVR